MVSGLNKLTPVSFKYQHDSNLKFNQTSFATQQGLDLNLVNALSSCRDETILNYSNIYLTDLKAVPEVISVDNKQPIQLTFPTYLALSAYPSFSTNTRYISLVTSSASTSPYYFTTNLEEPTLTYFIFQDLDGVNCRIYNIDQNITKCLTVNTTNLNCYFTEETGLILSSKLDFFEYSLDNSGSLKLFFRNGSNFYSIVPVNGVLSAVNTNVGLPGTESIFMTTWVANSATGLKNDFVYYTSDSLKTFSIDSAKTVPNIPQNFVLHYSYDGNNNFVDYNPTVAVDFYKTKNTLSHDYFVNDKLPFRDNVTQRKYTNILSKQNSEKFFGNFQLNYNYYTREYNFVPDLTTKFTLPASLYPYKYLNINNSSLVAAGSFGGFSPLYSDKVVKELNINKNIVDANEANGTYLYTWLYTNSNLTTAYWIDRYYYPQKTSILLPFTGSNNQIFNYTSSLSTYLEQNYSNPDFMYYDVRSSLMFEPSATYYYSRIGNKYISKVVDGLPKALSAFVVYNTTNTPQYTSDNMTFNGNDYGVFKVNQTPTNAFTLSFNLNSSNLDNIKSCLIIGNNFDEGVSLYKSGLQNIFTPGYFINTLTGVDFFGVDNTKISTFDVGAYVGSTVRILDIINTGFDHFIKILYLDTQTNIPGFLDFSITNNAYNKYEFPQLVNVFGTNNCINTFNRVYINENEIWYLIQRQNGSCSIRKFDYINGTYLGLVIMPSNIINSYNSFVLYNGNIVTLSGYKGAVLNNEIGVSKLRNVVYFKDLSANAEFPTLCAVGNSIFDLEVFGDRVYIQTNNQITSYDKYKKVYNTYVSSNSTVSGLKVDFINENFKTKLISYTTDLENNILVEKFDIDTGEKESLYNTFTKANPAFFADLVTPTGASLSGAPFQVPVNFAQINDVNKFDQGDFVVRLDMFAGNNYVNKVNRIESFNANNDSRIALSFDPYNGCFRVYVDGILTNNMTVSAGLFFSSYYLNNNFGLGLPIVSNLSTAVLDGIGFPYLPQNYGIENFIVYSKALNQDEAKFDSLKYSSVDPINFDIPCGTRNSTDTAFVYNKMVIPGRKNNNIKLYIKNLELSDVDKQKLNTIMMQKLQNVIPVNTADIQFIYINE